MRKCVQECISGLTDDYGAVVLLKDLQGLTSCEIANAAGVPSVTERMQLHRVREAKAALEAGRELEKDARGSLESEPK